MPKRQELLVKGEIYHIYNRSSGNEDIFFGKKNLDRALTLLDYYCYNQPLRFSKYQLLSGERKKEYLSMVKKQPPLVEIYSFSFMSDHYHFLLKQMVDNGIREFISNFQNAFAKYFNIKYENRGSLFINPFKSRRITSDEIFTHVSRYIHLNPVTSYLIKIGELATYPATSYRFYTGNDNSDLVKISFLIKMFGSKEKYIQFVTNQVDYQRRLNKIKKFLIE